MNKEQVQAKKEEAAIAELELEYEAAQDKMHGDHTAEDAENYRRLASELTGKRKAWREKEEAAGRRKPVGTTTEGETNEDA